MTDALEREARSLGRYLLGQAPPDYAVAKYRALAPLAPFAAERWDGFDRALLAVAAWHPFLTRTADLHARFVRPATLLRKKLILMAAILEASPGSASILQASGGGMVAALASLAAIGLGAAISLVLGAVIFLPIRLWSAFGGGARA